MDVVTIDLSPNLVNTTLRGGDRLAFPLHFTVGGSNVDVSARTFRCALGDSGTGANVANLAIDMTGAATGHVTASMNGSGTLTLVVDGKATSYLVEFVDVTNERTIFAGLVTFTPRVAPP